MANLNADESDVIWDNILMRKRVTRFAIDVKSFFTVLLPGLGAQDVYLGKCLISI